MQNDRSKEIVEIDGRNIGYRQRYALNYINSTNPNSPTYVINWYREKESILNAEKKQRLQRGFGR